MEKNFSWKARSEHENRKMADVEFIYLIDVNNIIIVIVKKNMMNFFSELSSVEIIE